MTLKKGKFLTFELSKRSESLSGIVLNYNEEWIFIKRVIDFRLDGYTIFENAEKIVSSYGAYEKLATIILKKKKYDHKKDIVMPIIEISDMLNFITKNYTLIQLDNRKGDAFDVVKFIRKEDSLYVFNELTTNAKWRFKLQLPRKEVSVISFDTDYLNSLKLMI
jgi:hypothetical protein